jgi:hypothetical protein
MCHKAKRARCTDLACRRRRHRLLTDDHIACGAAAAHQASIRRTNASLYGGRTGTCTYCDGRILSVYLADVQEAQIVDADSQRSGQPAAVVEAWHGVPSLPGFHRTKGRPDHASEAHLGPVARIRRRRLPLRPEFRDPASSATRDRLVILHHPAPYSPGGGWCTTHGGNVDSERFRRRDGCGRGRDLPSRERRSPIGPNHARACHPGDRRYRRDFAPLSGAPFNAAERLFLTSLPGSRRGW